MRLLIPVLVLCIVGSGNTAFPLLKVGQGPRAAAMGESFTGLSDDASAIYWNPAGLGQLTGYQFALSHHEWLADIKDEVIHIALPAGPGVLGMSAVYTGEPDVLYWDQDLMRYESFRSWSGTLSAGYGLRPFERLGLGVAVTGLYQDLIFQQGYGCAFDIGAVTTPVRDLAVGIAARHLGLIWFDDDTRLLPVEAAAGVSYLTGMFRVTMDVVLPALFDDVPDFKAGIEVAPLEALALRIGYRTGPIDLSTLGYLSGLSAGVGINVGSLGFDYAVVPYGELGITHRLGIRAALRPEITDGRADPRPAVLDRDATPQTVEPEQLGTGQISSLPDPAESATETPAANRTETDMVRVETIASSLSGGIYAAGDSQPTGGVVVLRSPSYRQQTVGRDPGTFEIADLQPGVVILAAYGPSEAYLARACTLQVEPGDTVRHDFYLWKKGDHLGPDIVNFATNSTEIRDEDVPVLDRVAEMLKQDRSITRVELAGHTDSRENAKSELSLARAQSVRDYLVEKCGIAPERLVPKGHADEKPLRSNSRTSGRAWNRRAEITVLE